MARPKKGQPNRSDGMYEVKVTVGKSIEGKPIRKSFYSSISKADARQKAQEYMINKEAAARTGIITAPEEMTFSKWSYKWLEVYKKPNVSNNSYRNTYLYAVEKYLNPYFGTAKLTSIKNADVQLFFAKHSHLSESLLHKLKITLSAIFDTAIENDLMFKNPVNHVTYTSTADKHIKQVYTEEQLVIAKAYFKENFFDAFLMLETGVRRGELLGLMWKDVDFENRTIRIDRAITQGEKGLEIRPPKWDSYRTIPISTELAEMLADMKHNGLYIFPTSQGKPQIPRNWSTKLERKMQSCQKIYPDMPILSPHELRHTCGTQYRRNGVDIYTIQKLMGHKDINVTANTYVHDETEVTRKAAKIV